MIKTKRTKKAKREKRVTRNEKIADLKEHARQFEFQYKPVIIDLTKNAKACESETVGSCWRPDIFLNNNRTCDNCSLVTHCACPSKRLAKRRKNDSGQ